jgi:hypothetical protein
MAEQKDILKKLDALKNNEQFKVPDGYFDSLAGNVINRIKDKEKEEHRLETTQRPVIKLVRNQLAIAASFAVLFLLAYTAIKFIVPDNAQQGLTENEIFASLESELMELDEAYLYNLATEEATTGISETELTDEEIIDYLIEEGTDIDFTINDF